MTLTECIVKLSQANIHRANGPMFRMGTRIVEALNLLPATYAAKNPRLKRPVGSSTVTESTILTPQEADVCICSPSNAAHCNAQKHMRLMLNDVSISEADSGAQITETVIHSTHDENDPTVEPSLQSMTDEADYDADSNATSEYRCKKRMSAAIFRYFIDANSEQQADLGITIDASVQEFWRNKIQNAPRKQKLDDLGDSLLHSVNEILAGSQNFKQLVPISPSLHNNRTIRCCSSSACHLLDSCTLHMELVCFGGSWKLCIGIEKQILQVS